MGRSDDRGDLGFRSRDEQRSGWEELHVEPESPGQGEGTEGKSSPTLCREPDRDCGGEENSR